MIKSTGIGSLQAFASRIEAGDKLAVEAAGNTWWFYEARKERGCRVVVVNPQEFEVISHSVKKTDTRDAKLLADFLAKGLLPEVRMKNGDNARIASLAQTQDKLVKLPTTLKNKVNNLLSARRILLGKEKLSSEQGLKEVLSAPVAELEHMELGVLVEEIRHLNASIKKVDGILQEHGPKLPGWENITSINGIGDTEASILLSTIGNVEDFEDEDKSSRPLDQQGVRTSYRLTLGLCLGLIIPMIRNIVGG